MGGHRRRWEVRVHGTLSTSQMTSNGSTGLEHGYTAHQNKRHYDTYSLSGRWPEGGRAGRREWRRLEMASCPGNMEYGILATSILAFVLYLNTLPASFAYDDSRAILKNPDVTSNSPLSQIFFNDFWGTPLRHSGSHKSYRPLCVLTFRINHYLGGLDPWGYHLGNVILHTIVTALFTYTANVLLRRWLTATVAGVLFASHPVHTEAVAGIVGRADMLACLFFLLAFLCYVRYCGSRTEAPRLRADRVVQNGSSRDAVSSARPPGGSTSRQFAWLFGFGVCTLAAMLSKEHGITVLAVSATYDIFIVSRVQVKDLFKIYKIPGLIQGLLFIAITGLTLVTCRIVFMGSKAPEFAPADNPASDSDSLLTRTLTYNYLVTLNVWLLLFPKVLSFDWSMGAVPLVESVLDIRNLSTVMLYVILCYAACRLVVNLNKTVSRLDTCRSWQHNGFADGADVDPIAANSVKASTQTSARQRSPAQHATDVSTDGGQDGCESSQHPLHHHQPHDHHHHHHHQNETSLPSQASLYVLIMSFALLIFPFLPASNLFFYVGFVIAERVIYIPSLGYCILVAHGMERVYALYCEYSNIQRQLFILSVVGLLTVYSVRTVLRNRAWLTEENLYKAGIPVNPAKAWGNLANVLNSQGKHDQAEQAYRNALLSRANMADVHYNLGILLQDQKRYLEAIDSYNLAIKCRPRLTMAYLNLGIVYATLGHKLQAEQIYRKCAEIDISGLKDPRLHEQTKISALYNLGRLLADQERYQEAIEIYHEAVRRRPSHYAPQSLYNMLGEAYSKIDQLDDAEHWYKEALAAKPEHIPAHLTLAKLLYRRGQIKEAEAWFLKAHAIDKTDSSVYQHYGQFLSDIGRVQEAAENYLKAVKYNGNDFELLFNTANALRQANRVHEAEVFYRKCVELHPQEATAHMNLGAMLHFNGKLEEAEKSYIAALKLKPDDAITQSNLQKVRNLLGKSTLQTKK